jgi:hypothetical protein
MERIESRINPERLNEKEEEPNSQVDYTDLYLYLLSNYEDFPSDPEGAESFRLALIEHARLQRRSLMDDVRRVAWDYLGRPDDGVRNMGQRFTRIDKTRQKIIENRELQLQAKIAELVAKLEDNPNPELLHELQALILTGYESLILRLENAEREVLYNMGDFQRYVEQLIADLTEGSRARIKSEESQFVAQDDKRIDTLYGRTSERDVDAAVLLLTEIDALRGKELTDDVVYRILQRKYHPDVSEHPKSEEVAKLLNSSYDNRAKMLKV